MPKFLSSRRGSSALRVGLRPLLVATAGFAVGASCAGDFSVGVGASTGRGHVDCIASMPCDRGDTDFKLFAGYRVAEAVDLRLSWFDDGRFKGGDVTPLGTEFGGTEQDRRRKAATPTQVFLWARRPGRARPGAALSR